MQRQKCAIFFTLCLVLCTLYTLEWRAKYADHSERPRPRFKKIRPKLTQLDKESQKKILDVRKRYSKSWAKQEAKCQEFRSQLHKKCNGFENAIMTRKNSPLGSKIPYDSSTKTLTVEKKFFNLLPKEHPFRNKTWNTCAVVGNGGILLDSNCGKMIDSADSVFRCNLPPVEGEFASDVGVKTSLVTANPSILREVYESLNERRRPFAKKLQSYGDAMVLLPAFSFDSNTDLCYRAIYTIDDFNLQSRGVFFNPRYMVKLGRFWKARGVSSPRLSSGLMIVSLALEVCSNVHVYGFWPQRNHPFELHPVLQHYYNDAPTNVKIHSMPQEFEHLLKLHNDGVLKLHLEVCPD